MKKCLHHVISVITTTALVVSSLVGVGSTEVSANEANMPVKVSSEWVTIGAKLEKWNWKLGESQAKVNVIEVDLANPHIQVDTLGGKSGQMGNKQSTTQLARERGAAAAINGDFFTLNAEGAPFGVHIQSGKLVTSPGYISPKNTFALDMNRIPFIGRVDFDGTVTAANGALFRLFGINKTQYQAGFRFEGNSHKNRLHMYTDKWNMKNWVGASLQANYTVALVENNIVTQILENKAVESIPKGAFLLLGHGEAESFLKDNVQVGETLLVDYKLNPGEEWWMALDGTSLLVNQGKFITHSTPGRNARTAVGYSQDNRYMYLVTVEYSKESTGLTFAEFGQFLEFRGMWKAVNLDGGGSTAMSTRELGSFQVTSALIPSKGSERLIPNGIGIFSTAPQGKLAGWSMYVPKKVLINEPVTVQVKAYDEYYNPLKIEELPYNSKGPSSILWSTPRHFMVQQLGSYDLDLTMQGKTEKHTIATYGMADVKELKITTDVLRLRVGESVQAKAVIQLTDGTKKNVAPSSLDWRLIGVKGNVQADGTVTMQGNSVGMLVASYQGFSTAVPIVGGSTQFRTIDTFKEVGRYAITGHVGTESGTFSLTEDNGEKVGTFAYNFGSSEALRLAYLKYGTLGMNISDQPSALSIKVKGDKSGHWLRTEFRDALGAVHRVDLASKVNWEGWKTITVDLPTMAYPVTLNSIYVVHFENANDTTPNQGQLSFSNLQVQDWQKVGSKPISKSLTLTLDKKEALVNDQEILLDRAPVVVSGRTLLPLRQLSEIIGGNVHYLAKERKIEVFERNQMHSFWLDHDFMSVNGVQQTLDVKPQVSNGRTMLPVRAFVEAYGLYIQYDKQTKKIYIY
jgi:hypothetical protein